jgi:hypothetical protein
MKRVGLAICVSTVIVLMSCEGSAKNMNVPFGKGTVLYKEAEFSADRIDQLGKYLENKGYFNTERVVTVSDRDGKISIAVETYPAATDEKYFSAYMKAFATELSRNVFDSSRVYLRTFHLSKNETVWNEHESVPISLNTMSQDLLDKYIK